MKRAVFLLMMLPAPQVWAQEAPLEEPASVAPVHTAIPSGIGPIAVVTVAASRGERPVLDVPSAVTVLTEEEIRLRRPARSFSELLHRVPGVHGQETAPGQGSPFLRGLTGYHVLTLVDGVRLNGSFFRAGPNQYLAGIDPLLVRDVEVVRGQGSVLYGSDALGGVLAVHSRNPLPPPGTEPGSVWARPGAYFRWNQPTRDGGEPSLTTRAEISAGAGPVALIGGFDYLHFGDRETGKHRKTARNSQYSQTSGDFKLVYQPSESETITAALQRTDQRNVPRTHSTIYGEPYRGTSVGSDLRRDLDQSRTLVYLQGESNGRGIFDRLKGNVSLQRTYEQQTRDRSSGRTRTGFEVWTLGAYAEAETDLPLPVDSTLSYGLDYYHDFVDSFETDRGLRRPRGALADDAHYDNFGAYLQLELRFGVVDLVMGGRYALAHVLARDVDPDPTDTFNFGRLDETYDAFLGSAGLVVHLAPQLSLVGSVNQGFRAPNLSDTTSFEPVRSTTFDSPSPDIDPEETLTLEVGLKWDYPFFRGQAFYAYTFLDEFIGRVPTGNVVGGLNESIKDNFSDGSIQAVEAQGQFIWHPFSEALGLGAPDLGLSLIARFSWVRGYLDTLVSGRPTKDNLTRVPPARFGGILRWEEPGEQRFWAEVEAEFFRRQTRLSPSDERDTQRIPPGGTPGYTLWHVRVGANLFEQRLKASLGVENLFDRDYRAHGSGTNGRGRALLMALQVVW